MSRILSDMTQQTQRRAAIAGEIRAELARQGLTYTACSAATHISPSTLSRRLAGNKPFLHEELQSIAQFLGIKISDLTERTDVAA
jgi:transcriptional regulator with XRE-family HTH domain